MKTNTATNRRVLPLLMIGIAACTGIATLFHMKSTPGTPAPSKHLKKVPPRENQDSEIHPSNFPPKPESFITDPGPPEKTPGRSLAKIRGDQARQWWSAWKEAYPKELKKNLEKLSEKLDLSSAQMDSIRALFQKEEALWGEYLDRKLEPVFSKGEKPSFRSLLSQEYRTLINNICANTDNQVLAILTRDQTGRYSIWRETYNRDRYYWSEGSRRD